MTETTSEGRIIVTVVAKLRNAAMHAAAKQVGGQSALARRLGVGICTVGEWCNMQSCPPRNPTKFWTAERIDKLESDLMEITGLLLDDIFPTALRDNMTFLKAPKTLERTREMEADTMLRMVENFVARIEAQPIQIAAQHELQEDIAQALKTLSYREQEIIKMRYGISEDGYTYTLEEIGRIFNRSRDRIRQIEASAIRKLGERSKVLQSHLEDV